MPTLKEAVQHLYDTAAQAPASTQRLHALAECCVEQLASRGLAGVQFEVTLPGGAREKNWDLAYFRHNKPRLAISLKSILQNLSGTVPNRIDDLIGEVANLQMYSPEIVCGYLIVFDVSQDQHSSKHGQTWAELLAQRLKTLTGRKMPAWGTGMIEASQIIRVNFSNKANLLTPQKEMDAFFQALVEQVNSRNP
jgi:hypothetical protein